MESVSLVCCPNLETVTAMGLLCMGQISGVQNIEKFEEIEYNIF